MPSYTLCLLVRENLSEADRDKVLLEVSKTLTDSVKPEIISWGKRDLAYSIAKQTQADYYLLNFEAESSIPAALDKKLKLTEEILRFLVIRRAGKVESPKSAQKEKVAKAPSKPEKAKKEPRAKKVTRKAKKK